MNLKNIKYKEKYLLDRILQLRLLRSTMQECEWLYIKELKQILAPRLIALNLKSRITQELQWEFLLHYLEILMGSLIFSNFYLKRINEVDLFIFILLAK